MRAAAHAASLHTAASATPCRACSAPWPCPPKGHTQQRTVPALQNKAISDDPRIKLAMPLFLLIDWLLSQPRVARYLFDKFRSPDNVRQVLQVREGQGIG